MISHIEFIYMMQMDDFHRLYIYSGSLEASWNLFAQEHLGK
jgi:hypothetical protein